MWYEPGRKYFPDEQVHPDEILRVLREHKADAPDLPWLTAIDVGWRVGAIQLYDGLHMRPDVWDLERRWRRLPWGYRWRHRVGQRDVSTGLLDLEVRGVASRLPRFARSWAYWVAVEDPEELAAMVAFFADRAEARAKLKYDKTRLIVDRTRRAYGCPEVSLG